MRAPSLPFPVRAFNRLGAVGEALRVRWPGLHPEKLLESARRRTGLEDFGGLSFLEGLRRLSEAWEKEAALTPFGRILARSDALGYLENRLRIARVVGEHPEITRVRIEQPVFVVGMPRTGTTILHELLAQDPANRVPMTWEVARPCPPPERQTYETDPRIAEVQARLDRVDRILPDFKKMHPMGATLPQECVAITAHEFASLLFSTTHRVPSYTRWLLHEAELGPAYRFHRLFLQLLQWRCPGRRWVLKSPGHLWSLPALLAEYPDARLVQTHRDPLRIVASLTSLAVTLRSMASDKVDPKEIAREWSETLRVALERSVDARERGLVRPECVVDLSFGELVADPIAAVRRIYERFDFKWTGEAERRMRSFLAAHPRDRYGPHVYRFANTGLDPVAEREKVRGYVERFDVPREEV
ncbi:MAG: putative sulfotransferase [Candidatus Binatia bacterium]|nr:MAG: putative sulfotransferase [Candidatus Binatia bacterium]